jgi:hypothetical protein
VKTNTVFKLLAITLVLIFTIGPTTASTGAFELGKSAILSGYKSSSGYSQLISNQYASIVKPDPNLLTKDMTINLLSKNKIISWDPAFMSQTKQQSPSEYSFGDVFAPKVPSGCGCGCGG